jgi:hypothetical protein
MTWRAEDRRLAVERVSSVGLRAGLSDQNRPIWFSLTGLSEGKFRWTTKRRQATISSAVLNTLS